MGIILLSEVAVEADADADATIFVESAAMFWLLGCLMRVNLTTTGERSLAMREIIVVGSDLVSLVQMKCMFNVQSS